MKKRRHAKILELINSHDIETQEELQAFLLKNGYEVTQATISRDIKELRLVKDLSDKGRYIYLYLLYFLEKLKFNSKISLLYIICFLQTILLHDMCKEVKR